MSIGKLAYYNFRKSFQNYFSMILSLAFTILIVFNFVNLTFAGTFQALGERNKEYIDIIIKVISFVLFCFMFFFIWYATNVFLTTRKKEIGIYIFMGLTNTKIAGLYMLETILMGITALILGICFGAVTTQLFQMILLKISEISIEISFSFTWKPVLVTAVLYIVLYAFFVLKGYLSIAKSSVLEMISASRQNEYVKTNSLILLTKAVCGIGILVSGYYFAVCKKGTHVIENLLTATVLVIIGTYLIFGGFLPMLFQYLAHRKSFLYQHERNLWINNVIFRMRKNYRTYAMTCILLTCSVTALAASFATKGQYDNMQHFRNTYTFQLVSSIPDMQKETADLIEKDNDIEYSSFLPFFILDGSFFSDRFSYGILSFSDVKKAAEDTGMDFPYDNLADDEVIEAGRIYLMSFITEKTDQSVDINGKKYRKIDETKVPYMGYLQESTTYYIVSDKTYEELLFACRQKDPQGGQFSEIYTYNYKIKDVYNYAASMDELDGLVHSTDVSYMGRVAIDPEDDEIAWIKVEYSLCVFVFMVFVLASGSILFMKLYNDAFEEKARYSILRKIGVSEKVLGKAAAKELRTAYAMPFLFMVISSCFSVRAIEKIMSNQLKSVNFVSIAIILMVLLCFYKLSVVFYKKNAQI